MELEIDVFVSIIGGYGRSVNIVEFRGVGSTSAGSGLRLLERYREGAEIPLLETVLQQCLKASRRIGRQPSQDQSASCRTASKFSRRHRKALTHQKIGVIFLPPE